MVTFAPCKINLGLDILSRRPDGYHDIDTVMLPVPWQDIVEIVPAADPDGSFTLTCTGYNVDCPPEKNLVVKALQAISKEHELPALDIFLHKEIPDGAGLGGGSSDAAAAAIAVNRVCNLGLDDDALEKILTTVGSDCPFFVRGDIARCTGTGTTLEPVARPALPPYIFIVKPNDCSVSTREAYAGVIPSQPLMPIPEILKLPADQWRGLLKNDFEPSVFAVAPKIAEIKETLYRHGAVYASMSGSGAAVYGLFNEQPRVYDGMFSDVQYFIGRIV